MNPSMKSYYYLIIGLITILLSFYSQAEVLLTLESSSGYRKILSREELEALPQESFTTSTPWTKNPHTYQGPRLSLVTSNFPQPFQSIKVYGINGYAYDIKEKELKKYPFILAMKQDGKRMALRNKGPLWVLLPFNQYPKVDSIDEMLNKFVWQVNRIKAQ
ncbi:hypothetical protein HC725_14495 [Vibrio sp. S17_S38]|uniref:hypothetical protein n=1 Tax=Vibrio sp. S17_S38 TaxID=2720229 RepID=UPI00168093B3|nr:hypothetical protein [Vibrio sp. S17_S38]MBD1574469.1 hypothetical protein [Vibrio sp. S17_S38]